MLNRKLIAAIALVSGLAATFASSPRADQWQVVDDDWCHGSKCEVREITLEPRETLRVRSTNGSIDVESWDRDEIRILARVKLSRVSSSEARELFEDIEIDTDDVIRADGPKRRGGGFLGLFGGSRGWSVSYRITVPRSQAIDVHTVNGEIEVADVAGAIEFNTTNGSVKLSGVGGDVSGGTTNGGIKVSLDPRDWHGEEVDLHTTNGGIKVDLPRSFSGRVDVATTNGGISVDHPVTIQSKRRNRLKGTIGDGDDNVLLRARTTNGGVDLRRADA
jgi:hypothetical protein